MDSSRRSIRTDAGDAVLEVGDGERAGARHEQASQQDHDDPHAVNPEPLADVFQI
jgi:hypothetical protein